MRNNYLADQSDKTCGRCNVMEVLSANLLDQKNSQCLRLFGRFFGPLMNIQTGEISKRKRFIADDMDFFNNLI